MKNLQKVEIITEKRSIDFVIEMIEKCGVTGYTLIPKVTGKGKRGIKHGDDLNDVFVNSMLITVCEEKIAEAIVKEIKVFLQDVSGVCIVTDVKYMVH
ncbi:MAG: transcriptional regulator [Opitutaceae bacterium]|nr:transcriptional regulator [Cytophagales bacterium]